MVKSSFGLSMFGKYRRVRLEGFMSELKRRYKSERSRLELKKGLLKE